MRLKRCVCVLCVVVFLQMAQYAFADADDDFFVTWKVQGYPEVMTNASTNIEETTAMLNGFLSDDGDGVCQYAFDYGTVSGEPYAFSTAWTGAITSPQEFSRNVGLLAKGELYFFRAKARNVNGTGYGSELRFLTKPDHPNDFQAVRNGLVTQIDLTWNIGGGADRTVIVRKVGSYAVDRMDGVIVYNGTGGSYNDGAVVAGTHYYYRAWSYCSEGGLFRYSDEYDEDNCLALAPSAFDIRNIVVKDNTVPHLEISVDVVNLGDILADVTVVWTLVRMDTGAVLDTGSDTVGVGPHTTQVYTIYPSTAYVGQVRVTFVGDGATAFQVFLTQSPPSGGGVVPPPKPPAIPFIPFLPEIPAVEVELPCLLFVLLLIILLIILVIVVWKRRKKKK